MAVVDVLKARRAEVLTFRILGRPSALKNSRASRGTYTVVNPQAKARLQDAKRQLREQHEGLTLKGCYDLEVRCYYADYRWWLDTDALLTFVLDALKGVVVADDKPKFLRDCTGRPRLSRLKQTYIEIELREAL